MRYPWLLPLQTQLNQQYTQSTLHHGLLFVGHEALGSREIMQQLAKYLLCGVPGPIPCEHCKNCQLVNAGTHPDLHRVSSDKQIGVDSIRAGITAVQSHAQLMGNKVLLIEGADTLTESAANALLKTLEEPTPGTYILLDTPAVERLLPTILSRCQHQVVPIPTTSVVENWLQAEGVTVSTTLIAFYQTKPLTLLRDDIQKTEQSFANFSRQLDELSQHSIVSVSAECEKDIDNTVSWLQAWLKHRCFEHRAQLDGWYSAYQLCLKLTPALRHPGTNKAIIINQILARVVALNHA